MAPSATRCPFHALPDPSGHHELQCLHFAGIVVMLSEAPLCRLGAPCSVVTCAATFCQSSQVGSHQATKPAYILSADISYPKLCETVQATKPADISYPKLCETACKVAMLL